MQICSYIYEHGLRRYLIMKKRSIVMAMAALMAVSAVTGCAGKAVSSDSTFTPKETINWTEAVKSAETKWLPPREARLNIPYSHLTAAI